MNHNGDKCITTTAVYLFLYAFCQSICVITAINSKIGSKTRMQIYFEKSMLHSPSFPVEVWGKFKKKKKENVCSFITNREK